MLRISRIIFCVTLIFAVVTACEAPTGSEGPQGPQGEAGPIGPAGEDGNMMYAGPADPTTDIGEEGDYYLNTTTGEYYGPKDADGWGNPIIVLMGENGQDGSVIHTGDGPPSTDTGVLGDYYFDKGSGDFYGPKTENGWGSPTNLTGDDGQDGADGNDGSVIHAGVGAPESNLGNIGDFYFDESSGDFYGPKTENGWGIPTNLMGEDGQDGADGQDGSQIYAGTGTPDASLGVEGDYYLDKSSYELYGPKTKPNKVSDGWGTPINLKGVDGNANVTRYIFPGYDFSADPYADASISGVSNPEENAWIVYLKVSTYTYHMPGWGLNGSSEYRVFHNGSNFFINLKNGPGEAYDSIEIVRIEASNTEDMTKQKGSITPEDIDTSNYQEIAEYYGFYK